MRLSKGISYLGYYGVMAGYPVELFGVMVTKSFVMRRDVASISLVSGHFQTQSHKLGSNSATPANSRRGPVVETQSMATRFIGERCVGYQDPMKP